MGSHSPYKLYERLSDRELARRAEQLAARIRREVGPLPEGEAAKRERVRQGEQDCEFFLKTYFPHWFPGPFAEMHRALLRALDARDRSGVMGWILFRIPRGWSKTTLAQGIALHDALYGRKHFIEFVGKTERLAEEMLIAVMLELEENARIKQDFGEQRTPFWSLEKGFRLKAGCWFDHVGAGGTVRGRKKGQHRPDLIIGDDLEDRVLVRNPQRVQDLIKWWLGDVVPSLAPGGTAVWLGTSITTKSPTMLLMNPEWVPPGAERPVECQRLSFPALNVDGESTWPEVHPTAEVLGQRAAIGRTAFNTEYQHQPENPGSIFRAEMWRYYTPEQLPRDSLVTVTVVDPAARDRQKNNDKAVIVLSKHLPTENYYVRFAWLRTEPTERMVEVLYECDEQFQPLFTNVEGNVFATLLRFPIDDYGRRVSRYLPYRLTEEREPKEIRIQFLELPASHGKLLFMKGHSDQERLREQLEQWPFDKDDGPDALARAYRLLRPLRLEGGGRMQSMEPRADFSGVI